MVEAKAQVRQLLAEGKLSEASDVVSKISPDYNDDKGSAGKLMLTAEVALADQDPAYALKVAKEAWTLSKRVGDAQLQADVLAVMVSGLYMKGMQKSSVQILKDALNAVGGTLPVVKEAGDTELEASVHHTHALVHFKIFELGGSSTPDEVLAAEEAALALYKSLGDKKGMATSLTIIAKAKNMLFKYGEAISAATEASQYWRTLGKAAGAVASLEIITAAQASMGSSSSGLDLLREELENFKEADAIQKTILLEYGCQIALDTGKTSEAIKLLEQEIDLLESRDEKSGMARKVLQAAGLYNKMGLKDDAVRTAKQAQDLFQELGEVEKEIEASALLETAETGQADTVAIRSKAKLALKSFIRAAESRDIPELRKYEAELSVFRSAIPQQEMDNALTNLFMKDSEALHFLEEQGWDCTNYKESQQIYVYNKNLFYIATILGGMNFGPQFQSVSPGRKGFPMDRDMNIVSVGHLPPFEEWHNSLLMKHGLLDMGMQQNTIQLWPPGEPRGSK